MSHPQNKRHRFLVGKHKGEKRAKGMFVRDRLWPPKKRAELIERHAQRMRDTGQRCSCSMCCNIRRDAWNKSPQSMQEKKFIEANK